MSHQPERKDNNCLNCGAIVAGRFCQACGQENIIPRQSVWGFIQHFLYDVFHFDGKFFETLRSLLFRPAFVPKEYIQGKRKRWLDPVRMYLFTSAVFFLVFFWLRHPEDVINFSGERLMSRQERFQYAGVVNRQLSGTDDSILQKQLSFLLDTSYRIALIQSPAQPSNDTSFHIRFENSEWLMVANKKDEVLVEGSGWLYNRFDRKWKAYKEKYGDDTKAMFSDLAKSFLHRLPYLLFVSLPFFALILKLLYLRKRNFYYSEHAVFTLYHYIFTFILLLFFFSLDSLYSWLDWKFLRFMSVVIFLSGGPYLLLSMKRFYGQGWRKTLVKFVLLNIFAALVLVVLMLLFIIFSFL